jgi:ribosomal protein S18 acetylase RimI-like enzyme
MTQAVKTTYLEMNSVAGFNPAPRFADRMTVQSIAYDTYICFVLFAGVGLPWRWYSRLSWSPEDWDRYFDSTNTGMWLGFEGDKLVGYFELEFQDRGDTEIKFIGLLPQYIGRGLGGVLLSHAVQKAWSKNTKRVWLHTCNNDAEAALNNYIARGFSVYREEVNTEDIPGKADLAQKIADFYRAYMDRYMAG